MPPIQGTMLAEALSTWMDNGRHVSVWTRSWDLLACCGLVASACLAYATLSEGNVLRLAIALPVLFFAPGYLLIEAVAGPASGTGRRAARSLVSIGVSPALIGLLALAAAVIPSGFRPGPIVVLLAVACGALAISGLWRRRMPTRQSVPSAVLT